MSDSNKYEKLAYLGISIVITLGLYLSSLYSYFLFHNFIEIITIAIAFALFILTWNTRKYLKNNYLKLLGIGYAFIALIDLVHTLAYKGMNVFPGYGANLPTQLWIAARYLQAVTLVAAPLLVERRVDSRVVFGGYAAAASLLVAMVYSGNFPDCFIEGKGLTVFKISSEYVISALFLASLYLLYRIRNDFKDGVYYLAVTSITFTVISEISFTAYVSVYGFANLVGHYAKLAAYYLMYRAILVTGLKDPMDLIFRDLKQAEESLWMAHDTLEEKVEERTAELHASEERYRVLIHKVQAAIVQHDGQGRILTSNPLAQELLGLSADQLLGRTLIDPEWHLLRENGTVMPVAEYPVSLVLATRLPLRGYVTGISRPDRGDIAWALVNGEPEYDKTGNITQVIVSFVDITERRKAEVDLRRAMVEIRDLYNNAPCGYHSLDKDGVLVQINDTELAWLGYARDEILGKKRFTDLITEKSLQTFQENFPMFQKQGWIRDLEFELVRKDGTLFPVLVSATTVYDDDGNYLMSRSSVFDITERKRMEDALFFVAQRGWMAGVENFFDALVKFLGKKLNMDFVVIVRIGENPDSAETVALYANGAIVPNRHYSLKGTPCENVMGRELCVYAQGVQQLFPEDALLVEMGAESYVGIPLWDFSGQPIGWIALMGSRPLFDVAPATQVLQLVATRASAELVRERSDRILRMREHEFRTLAANLPDNIVRYNREGRTIYINPVLEKTLGTAAAERMGKRVREFYSDGSYEVYAQALDDALASGTNVEIEFIVPGRSSDQNVHQICMIAERNEQGNVTGVLAIGRDITERKKAELERQANLRFFESMDRVNRAIQGAIDLDLMMREVLDVVLAIFDCDRVFLIYPLDPESPTWQVPMERAKPEYPGTPSHAVVPMHKHTAETFRLILAADGPVQFGSGPGQSLLRQTATVYYGIRSFMATAVYPKVGKSWQFGIHQCSHARVWTQEEMRLLQEIGRRLSDALTSLLMYRDLKTKEEFLNNIVENIPAALFVKDAETLRYVRFNRAGEQLIGYSREELLGKTSYDFFPKEIADFFTAKDREVLGKKVLVDIPEETIRTKDKVERILHTKKIPILDETGKPQFLVGISEDITERKRTEDEREKLIIDIRKALGAVSLSQKEWQDTFDSITDMISIHDKEYNVIKANKAFAANLGMSPRQVLNRKCYDLMHHGTSSPISACPHQRTMQDKVSASEEVYDEITKKTLGVSTFPYFSPDGELLGSIHIARDITEEKDREMRMIMTERLASLGQMASGIAHEINNPLQSVMICSEMLMMKVAKDSYDHGQFEKYLKTIEEEVQRCRDITGNMLSFARQTTVTRSDVDVHLLLDKAIDLVGYQGKLKNVTVTKKYGERFLLSGNEGELRQVFLVLLINALDAMENSGAITVETGADAASAWVRISDTGPGITPEDLHRIFNPFFSTKTEKGGTGLGLSIAYRIIANHRGSLTVVSEQGHGAAFTVTLPLS